MREDHFHIKPVDKLAPSIVVERPRASSKKTRIETPIFRPPHRKRLKVRGQVPRKQGLKPVLCAARTTWAPRPRASSKKTRIETCVLVRPGDSSVVRGQVPRKQGLKQQPHDGEAVGGGRPRASSKKTRIETPPEAVVRSSRMPVRGQVPRKQGLKHLLITDNLTTEYREGPRASSKKTRIET